MFYWQKLKMQVIAILVGHVGFESEYIEIIYSSLRSIELNPNPIAIVGSK